MSELSDFLEVCAWVFLCVLVGVGSFACTLAFYAAIAVIATH